MKLQPAGVRGMSGSEKRVRGKELEDPGLISNYVTT